MGTTGQNVGASRDSRPWRTITVRVPEDVASKFEEALEMARVFEVGDNTIEAIEAISIEFLHSYNLSTAYEQIVGCVGPDPSQADAQAIRRYNKLQEKVDSGFRCIKCEHSKNLHVHHIVPLSQGGTDDCENLACICVKCHEHIHSTGWRNHVQELKTKRREAHRQVQLYGHRVTAKHGKRGTWL